MEWPANDDPNRHAWVARHGCSVAHASPRCIVPAWRLCFAAKTRLRHGTAGVQHIAIQLGLQTPASHGLRTCMLRPSLETLTYSTETGCRATFVCLFTCACAPVRLAKQAMEWSHGAESLLSAYHITQQACMRRLYPAPAHAVCLCGLRGAPWALWLGVCGDLSASDAHHHHSCLKPLPHIPLPQRYWMVVCTGVPSIARSSADIISGYSCAIAAARDTFPGCHTRRNVKEMG